MRTFDTPILIRYSTLVLGDYVCIITIASAKVEIVDGSATISHIRKKTQSFMKSPLYGHFATNGILKPASANSGISWHINC